LIQIVSSSNKNWRRHREGALMTMKNQQRVSITLHRLLLLLDDVQIDERGSEISPEASQV
jgi:hypothetical protein